MVKNKNKKTNPEYYSYEVKGTACGDAEQVRRKLEKQVTSISPVQIKIKQEKKPEVTETVLKINLHCEGCANDVRRCVRKMAGVQSVEPDMNASTVTIKSTVDPEDLIARIKKKTGKNAEVVIPKNQKGQNQNQKGQNQNQKGQNQNQKGQNQNQNAGEEMDNKKKDERNIGLSYPNYPSGLVYATEILSDENPNACSIM